MSKAPRYMRAQERRDVSSIFETYRGAVESLALRETGNRADADDVVQEVMLRLCRVRGDVRNPGAWLSRVTRNEAIRLRAGRAIGHVSIEDEASGLVSGGVAVDVAFAEAERLEAVADAVDQLPTSDRMVLERCMEEGATIAAVARRLGVHRRTVERARRRCLEALRPILTEKAQ